MIDNLFLPCILCSVAGCLIRYMQLYEKGYKVKIFYFITDILTAGFLGFMVGWFVLDHFDVKRSYSATIALLVGNVGGRILDFITWSIQLRYGIPTHKPHINTNWGDNKEDKDDGEETSERPKE